MNGKHSSQLKTVKKIPAVVPLFALLTLYRRSSGLSAASLFKMSDFLRVATQVNKWQGTYECITWFNKINNKKDLVVIKYDICDFYPSINEKVSRNYAKQFVSIQPDYMEVILHCRKHVSFHSREV